MYDFCVGCRRRKLLLYVFNKNCNSSFVTDLLAAQNNLLRNPSHELRAACFLPLKLALESKRSKLVSLSLTGLNKIIRDERFQSGPEPEDDSLWLPAQLLFATSSTPAQCEDTQVHVLRVVLSLACSAGWALNGRLVMLMLGRCAEAYDAGTQPVRAAAQAAASQTLTAFCTFLGEYSVRAIDKPKIKRLFKT
ncbi:unnamed protein product [Phaedon cochleariae]|uniref:Mon2/Sec7/BIG1-like dimerisation and cyclophilin-binding domain-containing protein n=1 Tax=Phaedon cochleariae TaxID=80249 RepID=A0A9P0DQJ4_PHACE|nr:unnamed protein product [Phaedon cochleariae]